jgi:uncharacterized protein YggE
MPEPAASPTADQRTVTVMGEGLASAVPDTDDLLHRIDHDVTHPREVNDELTVDHVMARGAGRPR